MRGDPRHTRVDSPIDFDDLGLPDANLTETARSHLGIRWTGFLQAPLSENFTFSLQVSGSDVARLFLANQLVVYVDNTWSHTPEGWWAT